MLTVPQIESLRTSNPQLYEALKRLAEASLGPNQGWSLDDQITDGSLFARVTSGALTSGKVDPAKSGVLMKGSVPPTWSGAFTYVSTTTTHHVVVDRPHNFARRRHDHRGPQRLARDQRTHRRHHLLFLSLLGRRRARDRLGRRRREQRRLTAEFLHRENKRRRATASAARAHSAFAGRSGRGHHKHPAPAAAQAAAAEAACARARWC